MTASATSDLQLIKRLLLGARRYWPHIAGILLIDLLATPLALITPLPLKIAIDSIIGTEPVPEFLTAVVPAPWLTPSALLAFVIVLLALTAALTPVQVLAASMARAYTGGKLVLQFRNRLFRHAQRLSFTYHDMRGVSDTLYRVQYDTAAVERVLVDTMIPMFAAGVTLVSMVYVTAQINAQLALVAVAVAPVIVLLNRFYRRPLRSRWREQKRIDHAAMSVVNEVFSALRVVKAYSQEEREQHRYSDRASASLYAKLKATLLQGTFDILATLMTTFGTVLVLYIGIRAIQSGTMSVGDLLIVMTYIAMLYTPLRTMGRKAASLQSALASADRAFALIDECPDVPEIEDAVRLTRAVGDFSFDGVSFAYNPGEPVLRSIELVIPAGTRVGIVGETGAGKSTLLSLLMRFYDPTEGRILLDGVDLREYRLKDLRRQFALVLQDTILFSTSVHENIAYANPDASDQQIIDAAEAAHAHEFINRLPDGYATVVGERGMRLSGGERQRIAIARAFLRDAPVLLFDEPTSAVDTRTEAAIMEVMGRLMEGRTTFMIAHRLSTLENCDVLLRLQDGRLFVVDEGAPDPAYHTGTTRLIAQK